MRSKLAIITVCIAAILIVCYFKFFSDFSYLVTTKGNITNASSSGSGGTFKGKKGEKVDFFCNSTVKQGTLAIVLKDSTGKVVKNFQTNKDYKEQISLDNEGEYDFSVKYENFVGNFDIKCK
jgi:flagellar hook assembly protein FlgD